MLAILASWRCSKRAPISTKDKLQESQGLVFQTCTVDEPSVADLYKISPSPQPEKNWWWGGILFLVL
jgi:hypothetical protein